MDLVATIGNIALDRYRMNKNLVMLVFMVILAVGLLGASTVIADVAGLYGSENRDQVSSILSG